MERLPANFDWDDGNREKCQKHGVSVTEIEAFLSGTPRFELRTANIRQPRRGS